MIVGVTGCSGSGKTTIVKYLTKILGDYNVCYLNQDSYYRDQSHILYDEREKINYDHPETLEMELLEKHLLMLSKGESIYKPIYDFKTHTRKHQAEKILPQKIIFADGIHVLTKESVRKIIDLKVYVDTDPDISFIRRLLRDTKKRGRSVESVINQYIASVKPMQEKYIIPIKKHADFIISDGGLNQSDINELAEMIKRKCYL